MKKVQKHSFPKRFIMLFGMLGVALLALLALTVRPSQAAVGDLVFTIEAPLRQESRVTCPSGLGLETFNEIPVGDYASLDGSIGDYTDPNNAAPSIRIFAQAATGGARFPETGATRNFISTPSSYLLTLDQPAGYFGFWWSAGDGNNKVTVNMADGSSQVFTTQSILDSGAVLGVPGGGQNGHYGNPTGAQFGGQLDTELFAFVNIFATNPNAKIESLLFEQDQGSQGEFETDNHTVCADILNPDTGTPIPQVGSITIVKEANPESEQLFSFLTSIGGPGQGFQLKDNGTDPNSKTFNDLPPSSYNVFEQVPTGWTLDPVQCSGGADIITGGANVQITLSGGEDVTCTFTNRRTAVNLTIVKEATGGDGTFEFDSTQNSGVDIPKVTLVTQNGVAQQTLSNLPAGDYEIAETLPAGWTLADIVCEGVTDDDWSYSPAALSLSASPGDDITCTFKNTKQAKVTITKEAVPAESTEFAFDQDLDSSVDLKLQPGQSQEFLVLPGADYTVKELPKSGWYLDDLTCTEDGDQNTDTDKGTGTATIRPEAGETIECTYSNVKTATIIIEKVASDDQTLFEFSQNVDSNGNFVLTGGSSQIFLDVRPDQGPYVVSEQGDDNQNVDYDLVDLRCSDDDSTVDKANGEVTINVDPGELVTCTFTNVEQAKLTDHILIVKRTVPAGGTGFDFEFSDGNQVVPFTLDDLFADDFEVTSDGTYTVTEQDPGPNYALSEIDCFGGGNPQVDKALRQVSFDFQGQGNESGYCIFTNTLINACPVDPNVGNLQTDLLGVGQGSPTKGIRTRKLVIPNYQNVDSLYGQLAAVDVGVMKYVRFRYPNGAIVQVKDATSLAYRMNAVSWWGSDLTPSPYVKGQFFWGAKGSRSPRAFVLWPTYTTTEEYANVFTVFDESTENHVYWDVANGWYADQTQTIAIPETQVDGAAILVKVALVDNNKDGRPVILTVSAGNVSQQVITSVPSNKDLLNLEEILLENVPRGTSEVVLHLASPAPSSIYPAGGDSVAMIGAAASYSCELPTPNP